MLRIDKGVRKGKDPASSLKCVFLPPMDHEEGGTQGPSRIIQGVIARVSESVHPKSNCLPKSKPRMLDLFSGTGTVGKVFQQLGYEVTSLDIKSHFHPTICADICEWEYKQYPPGYLTPFFVHHRVNILAVQGPRPPGI